MTPITRVVCRASFTDTAAFAHAKFVAYAEAATTLFEKAGVPETDGGFVALKQPAGAKRFIDACRKLRFWEREAEVHAVCLHGAVDVCRRGIAAGAERGIMSADGSRFGIKREHGEAVRPIPWLPRQL